ncbi:hypothetical protein HDU83_007685 [Entophlyctis luteolus]|nr:hypothetical protein HDU82_008168 [Entophlyctis luteolus]KAJ3352737.1 hypothetical protein HDU83_007685 [Entophlyctis luteolus]
MPPKKRPRHPAGAAAITQPSKVSTVLTTAAASAGKRAKMADVEAATFTKKGPGTAGDAGLSTSITPPSPRSRRQSSSKQPPQTSFNAIVCTRWFESLADPDDDQCIGIAGIERLCNEIDVDIGGQCVLALAYRLNAKQMGIFSRAEWMNGMQLLGADSIKKLKQKIPELESLFSRPDQVKEMYKWAFYFGKESCEKKYIDVEIGKGLWKLLLADRNTYRHVDLFIEYLEEEDHVKVINRDQWTSFFDFSTSVEDDLSNYEDNAAWPVLLDDFVEHVRQRRQQGHPG